MFEVVYKDIAEKEEYINTIKKDQLNSLVSFIKVTDGFEPTIRELQSHALPLG